jgi:hypothetical protein
MKGRTFIFVNIIQNCERVPYITKPVECKRENGLELLGSSCVQVEMVLRFRYNHAYVFQNLNSKKAFS